MSQLTRELLILGIGLALGVAISPWRARLRAGRLLAGVFAQSPAGRWPGLKAAAAAGVAALVAAVLAVTLQREIPFTLMGLVAEPWARAAGVSLGALLVAASVNPTPGRQWGGAFAVPALAYAVGGLGLMVFWSALRGGLWGLQGTALGSAGYRLRERLDAPGERLAGLLGGATRLGGERERKAPHPGPLPREEGDGGGTVSAFAWVVLICLVVLAW